MRDDMRPTRLANESQEYLSKREELLSLEIESMKLREQVAETRRQLPQGPVVKDYMFLEGPAQLDGGGYPDSYRSSQRIIYRIRSLAGDLSHDVR
jgi:predicted dithiol-disulfide oxidoreductase (DUF899 family)